MTIFTIHVPKDAAEGGRNERIEMIPDAFSWGAFLFGPLWLLRNRLWLALLGWIAAFGVLWLLYAERFAALVVLGLALLCEFLLGLEGNGLLASALGRRGLVIGDVVAASAAEAAAQIYFERGARLRPAVSAPPKPAPPAVATEEGFVGLSPEAGG